MTENALPHVSAFRPQQGDRMFPAPVAYAITEPGRHKKDLFWIGMFLRKAAYRVVGLGELPEAQGLTVVTETPVSAEHQEILGLKPLEEVLDPA